MLSVDDLLALRTVGDAWLSPDGRRVAFVVGAALAGSHATPEGSRIWLVDAAGGAPRQLTRGPGRESAPAWSPDGRTLAFLSDRAARGTNRLYFLPLDGGEAWPVDTPPGDVKALAWAPDGTRLAIAIATPLDENERDDKDAPVVVERDRRFDRVWLVPVVGGEATPAYDEPVQVWELAWAPGGDALALVVSDEPTEASWYANRLAWLDLAGRELRTLHTPPAGRQIARPLPSPDGARVAFVSCSWSDPGMSGGDLWLVPSAGGGEARNLTPDAPFSVNSAAWASPDRLLYEAYDDGGTSFGWVTLDGTWRRLWRGPYSFGYGRLQTTLDGTRFAKVREGAAEPGDVWLGQANAETLAWRRLTALHGDLAGLPGPYEELRWRAPDGLEIGGLLLRPAGEGPFPLAVLVHGGPTGMTAHRLPARGWNALAPLLAARGVAVLQPNYRGSNGRGVAFAEANHGDLGGGDFADVLAGVDRLVADGVADPDRLGIGGWSYGGFLTLWAVTQTNRFKVAVAGAGIADWFSMHGTTSLHSWERIFLGPDPYDGNGIFARRSPVLHARAVTTPVLLLHGDADRDVPPSQSQEFYRALRDYGAEVEFVRYPGAPHGPHAPAHVRDIMERGLAWFTDRLAPAPPAAR